MSKYLYVVAHGKEILGQTEINIRKSKKTGRVTSIDIDNDIIKTKHPMVGCTRKPSTLKLGAETEEYNQTTMWGYNIMDTYHRVRQAMALNSSLQSGGLKYIAKEAGIERNNRVYIDGTIDQDGTEKIAGSTDPLTVSTERAANTLVYVDSTQGWLLKNN